MGTVWESIPLAEQAEIANKTWNNMLAGSGRFRIGYRLDKVCPDFGFRSKQRPRHDRFGSTCLGWIYQPQDRRMPVGGSAR